VTPAPVLRRAFCVLDGPPRAFLRFDNLPMTLLMTPPDLADRLSRSQVQRFQDFDLPAGLDVGSPTEMARTRVWLFNSVLAMIAGVEKGTNIPQDISEPARLLEELQRIRAILEAPMQQDREEIIRLFIDFERLLAPGLALPPPEVDPIADPIVCHLAERTVPARVPRVASEAIGADYPAPEEAAGPDWAELGGAAQGRTFMALKDYFESEMERLKKFRTETEQRLREEAKNVSDGRRALLEQIKSYRSEAVADSGPPVRIAELEDLRREVLTLRHHVDELMARESRLATIEKKAEIFDEASANHVELIKEVKEELSELAAAKEETQALVADLRELWVRQGEEFSAATQQRRTDFLNEFEKTQQEIDDRRSELEAMIEKLKESEEQRFRQISDDARIQAEPLLRSISDALKAEEEVKLRDIERDLERRRNELSTECGQQIDQASAACKRVQELLEKQTLRSDELFAQLQALVESSDVKIRDFSNDTQRKRDALLERFEEVLAEVVAARDAIIRIRDAEDGHTRESAQCLLGELTRQLGEATDDRMKVQKDWEDALEEARSQFEKGLDGFIAEKEERITALLDRVEGVLNIEQNPDPN
jgi:hypothetical protein